MTKKMSNNACLEDDKQGKIEVVVREWGRKRKAEEVSEKTVQDEDNDSRSDDVSLISVR